MDRPTNILQPDRWWIVALFVSIAGIILAAILWYFPASPWAWAFALGILIFSIVCYLNPRYRYWHRATWCFGVAGVLAVIPTIISKANFEGFGAFEFVSESSPVVVLGFLAAGLYLAWLDSRQHVSFSNSPGIESTLVNSPHAVTGLTAGGSININQGISEDMLRAMLDPSRPSSLIQASSAAAPREVDEELVWRMIDDIKDARRRFEREEVTKLLANLQKSFERSGIHWPKVLRTETLLLMAEEERARIFRLQVDGNQVDFTRLQELLKELRNA